MKRFSAPSVGAASLMVIFTVLCLTIFSLLSLSSALADRRLSDAVNDSVQAYYKADAEAEAIYARLRAGEVPAQVHLTGDTYAYACTVSETQQLQVQLKNENGSWAVLQWQLVTLEQEHTDADLPVWDGG